MYGLNRSNQKGRTTAAMAKSMSSSSLSQMKLLLILATIFMSCLSLVYILAMMAPYMEPEHVQHVHLPRSLQDAQNLFMVLSNYTDDYYTEVLGLFCITFVFLQTFAIPGSIFLSVLSGALFSQPVALSAVCLCSGLGASLCYLISFFFGRALILRYFKARRDTLYSQVNKQRDNVLFYIIFLRVTPLLPNWFINVTAPIVDVPILPFFLGTVIGVAPPSLLAVQMGKQIMMLTSIQEANPWRLDNMGPLVVAAILSIAPIVLKKTIARRFETGKAKGD